MRPTITMCCGRSGKGRTCRSRDSIGDATVVRRQASPAEFPGGFRFKEVAKNSIAPFRCVVLPDGGGRFGKFRGHAIGDEDVGDGYGMRMSKASRSFHSASLPSHVKGRDQVHCCLISFRVRCYKFCAIRSSFS